MNPETENLTLEDIARYASKCREVSIWDLAWNKGDMVKCYDYSDYSESYVSKNIILSALRDNNILLKTLYMSGRFQDSIEKSVLNYLKKQLEIT